MPEIMAEMIEKSLSPALLLKTTKKTRSSDAELVKEIEDRHSKWVEADKPNRDRLFEALGAFYDINAGSWPEKEKADLIAQGRHPVSLNIAEQKLTALAGSIRAEKWDYDYLPLDLNQNSLIKNIKHFYYADKEQYNYEFAENKTLIRGLIHCGYEEMEVRYDIRPTGGIGFISNLPGTVLEDPYWQSDKLEEWERAMKDAWMTPAEIIEKYETTDPNIQLLANVTGGTGEFYEETGDIRALENVPETWGSKLLVIEYRWLEKLKTTRLYGYLPRGEVIPFPLNAEEKEVRDLMAMYGIKSWEQIKEFPYEDKILKLATICPQASKTAILAQGNHPIQCGMIGFFPFSSCREMGVKKGTFEALIDLNRTLNYREMKKDDIIASGAAGGLIVDKTKLGPNAGKIMKDIKENRTKPNFVLGVDGPVDKAVSLLPNAEVPDSIWNDIATLVDMFDRVSPVTPALEGRGEKGESGILLELRHAITKLGTLILNDNWMHHLMNKAEAWYNQAQHQYSGIYREVLNKDTNEVIEFNSPVFVGGKKGYLNSVTELPPRAQVIVTLSKSSPTERFATRMQLYDMTKILAAHPDLFSEEIRTLMYKMFNTMDMSPEEKYEVQQTAQLKRMRDIYNLMVQIKEIEGRGLNAEILIKQAQGMLRDMIPQQQGPQIPEAIAYEQPQVEQPQGMPDIAEGSPDAPGAPIETIRGEFQP